MRSIRDLSSWGGKMHFVVLGTHSAEVCPTGNAKTKALLLEMGPQVSSLAEKHGVNIVAGPFANREHMLVVIVETDRAEALDSFLVETRLPQWNQVRILPSVPMQAAMQEVQEATPLFLASIHRPVPVDHFRPISASQSGGDQ
jgi:uncharacterized protein with GYD domain